MRGLFICLALIAFNAHAVDVRVYQTNKHDRIQYSKPSYTIRPDGRIIRTDPYGNKLYSKQQYQIRGDKIIPVDAYGNKQYNKPTLVIEGRKNASAKRGL